MALVNPLGKNQVIMLTLDLAARMPALAGGSTIRAPDAASLAWPRFFSLHPQASCFRRLPPLRGIPRPAADAALLSLHAEYSTEKSGCQDAFRKSGNFTSIEPAGPHLRLARKAFAADRRFRHPQAAESAGEGERAASAEGMRDSTNAHAGW